jgi:hypothetical protein
MEIPTDPGLTMTCYTAEPGTASEENLKLLASWGATLDQAATARDQVSDGHSRRSRSPRQPREYPVTGLNSLGAILDSDSSCARK